MNGLRLSIRQWLISVHRECLKSMRSCCPSTYFDHDWLLQMLEHRIQDKAFTGLIRRRLKAGILDTDGEIIHPESGSPRGGKWKAFHLPLICKNSLCKVI